MSILVFVMFEQDFGEPSGGAGEEVEDVGGIWALESARCVLCALRRFSLMVCKSSHEVH